MIKLNNLLTDEGKVNKRLLVTSILFIIFLLFEFNTQAQKKVLVPLPKKKVTITAQISDLPAGYHIEIKALWFCCVGCPPIATVQSIKGGFTIKTSVTEPTLARLLISSKDKTGYDNLNANDAVWRVMYLYLDAGLINITGSFQKDSFNYSGFPSQSDLVYFHTNIQEVHHIPKIVLYADEEKKSRTTAECHR